MEKIKFRINVFMTLLAVFIMLIGTVLPSILAVNVDHISGFDKGPSYKPVVPMEKVTFVNFDEDSYLDDYAYLAAIPTSVFDDGEKLFSNPLLFYQDEYKYDDDIERSFNAREGLDYFMEDWMTYCNGKMDKMTLINVPENKLDSSWKAKEYTTIEGDNPYEIANQIALSEWSYSDDAVVAIIDEEFEESVCDFSNRLKGEIPVKELKTEHFEVPQTNQLDPIFNEFTVPEGYKYIKARVWYPCFYRTLGFGAFEGLANVSIPSGDKDLQLYCNYNDDWMQTAAISEWNQKSGMDHDIAESYVYKNGKWRVSITDVPTKGGGRYGTFFEAVKSMILGVVYQVDITLYPGVIVAIPENPPFGCRDINFKLTWEDENEPLGFSIIGPAGEEIVTSSEGDIDYKEIHLDQIGQCLDGENYKVCVYSLDGVNIPVSFELEYSWKQNITEKEGFALSSATEGAVLGSILNSPLLYVKSTEICEETKEALYKLGVENVYLVDLGGQLDEDVIDEINCIGEIKTHYTEYNQIYDDIMDKTGSNDVIFSTLDPYTYWYVTEIRSGGEYDAALPLGPAAFLAAHHGSPVIIVDSHPELSSAVVWHTEFWKRTAYRPNGNDPSVAEMHLTGKRVYDFLGAYGFDQIGRETIITVAGQYDIAPSWSRMFAGMAKSAIFLYTPVDQAYWINRNMFYPALIFVNPAMNPDGVELTTGGENKRRMFPSRGPLGLKTIKEPSTVRLKYPVHLTFASYTHRFNERAGKYYGFKYQSADGIVPGETRSLEPIDQDSIKKYTGKDGAFWPDMSASDIIPFYMEKGDYDIAYCSNFVDTMSNINKGVIYWSLSSHGFNTDSGLLIFWDPTGEGQDRGCISGGDLPPGTAAKKDLNPWRSYEWLLGSTDEPDTMSFEIHGIIPMLLGNPNFDGLFRTALDFAPAKKPIRDAVHNVLAKIPIINRILPQGMLDTNDYYDGQICEALFSVFGYTWYTGYAMDDELENLHSMVFLTGVCLTATKYAHLTLIRHGSVAQIIDPWSTSWYGTMWQQSIPRDLILGDTLGEAYNKGISHVGILHIGDDTNPPQWWWDNNENVCMYGDPNLRMFVPGKTYSDKNYWERDEVHPLKYSEELNVDGHMPFGATEYSHEKEPEPIISFWFMAIIIILAIVVVAVTIIFKKTKKR